MLVRRSFAEVDFCKHYRHCLMYPGYGWAVYSPTDSFVQGDTEAHWCFVDNGPAAQDISDKVYLGPAWYPQPLVRAMLCLLYTSPSPRD